MGHLLLRWNHGNTGNTTQLKICDLILTDLGGLEIGSVFYFTSVYLHLSRNSSSNVHMVERNKIALFK